MSLYGMIFGVNPAATLLKLMFELDQDREGMPELPDSSGYDPPDTSRFVQEAKRLRYYPTGRFRDIWLSDDRKIITLYTRNGGGNRDRYQWVFECLVEHPEYIGDEDDDFDSTYAYIRFKVPERFQPLSDEIPAGDRDQWDQFLADLQAGRKTAQTQKAFEGIKPLLEKLNAMLTEEAQP